MGGGGTLNFLARTLMAVAPTAAHAMLPAAHGGPRFASGICPSVASAALLYMYTGLRVCMWQRGPPPPAGVSHTGS